MFCNLQVLVRFGFLAKRKFAVELPKCSVRFSQFLSNGPGVAASVRIRPTWLSGTCVFAASPGYLNFKMGQGFRMRAFALLHVPLIAEEVFI